MLAADLRAFCEGHPWGLDDYAPCVPRTHACPLGCGKNAALEAAMRGLACEGEGIARRDPYHTALPRAKGTAADLRPVRQR